MAFRLQLVEQFGVRRPRPLHAEVFGRAHQAPAEVRLPDLVHHHPPDQRVVLAHEPAGEREPVRGRARRERVEHRGHPRLDRVGLLQELAALVDLRDPRVFGGPLRQLRRDRQEVVADGGRLRRGPLAARDEQRGLDLGR